MTSSVEAELGAFYINAREAVPLRNLLEEMGYQQPLTPIQIDNTTALRVVINTIQQKLTKSMDKLWYTNHKYHKKMRKQLYLSCEIRKNHQPLKIINWVVSFVKYPRRKL